MKIKIFLRLSLLFTLNLLITTISIAQTPSWVWAKGAGGQANVSVYSVAVDDSGYVYMAGDFGTYDINFGSFTLVNNGYGSGYPSMFVVKYDASGNVLWAKGSLTSGRCGALSIACDHSGSGDIYVSGYFGSPSITFDASTLINDTTDGSEDLLIIKFSSNGNVLWARSAGGTDYDSGNSVSSDVSGNVYVGGVFESSFLTFGSDTLINAGNHDVFIAKYDSSGNILWARKGGGSDNEVPRSVVADAFGHCYMTGSFQSSNIIFGNDTLINNSTIGLDDLFFLKYDMNGNLLWAKEAGGLSNDRGLSIATDVSQNVYLAGTFRSLSLSFDTTILTNITNNIDHVFLVKFDSSGNVIWAKKNIGVEAASISTAASGDVFLTGCIHNSPITFDSITLTNTGGFDLFIVKYNMYGHALWVKSVSGSARSTPSSIAIDPSSNEDAYVVGEYDGTTIDFGSTTLNGSNFNEYLFIAKLSTGPVVVENIESNNEIIAYPNPSDNYFTIKIVSEDPRKCSLVIADIAGREVERKGNIFGDGPVKMGYHLSPGIYFVELIQGNSKRVMKLVKNN